MTEPLSEFQKRRLSRELSQLVPHLSLQVAPSVRHAQSLLLRAAFEEAHKTPELEQATRTAMHERVLSLMIEGTEEDDVPLFTPHTAQQLCDAALDQPHPSRELTVALQVYLNTVSHPVRLLQLRRIP